MQHSVIKISIDGENLYYICNPYDYDRIKRKLDHANDDSILTILNTLISRRELVLIEEMVTQEYVYDVQQVGWRDYWGMKKGVMPEGNLLQPGLL